VEAFPWETAPRYLLRDRDAVYGVEFSSRVKGMGICEVKTAPRSPWQNPYVERVIGTLRRECLDHVVVLNETHLRRLLSQYLIYYHRARTHLSLDQDAPEPRRVERLEQGRIVETPMVGGLHIAIPARRRKILRACEGPRRKLLVGRSGRFHLGLPAPCL
jgi:transposase InsO family protein